MKKEFEFPELSIYELGAVDIVTTSMPESGEGGGDNDIEWDDTLVN